MPGKSGGNTRFLLVTSSLLLQEGLCGMLGRMEHSELACVQGPDAFLVHGEQHGPPDVLIVEPGFVDAIRTCLRERGWRCRILVLWARAHTSHAQARHAFGLCGLLRICLNGPELVTLLEDVAHCRHSCACDCGNWQRCGVKKTIESPSLPLSRRELDVFQLVGGGLGTKDVARQLSVSVKTVESHRENIKRKLELDNGVELLEAAILWRRGEFMGAAVRPRDSANDPLSGDGCLDDDDRLQPGRGI